MTNERKHIDDYFANSLEEYSDEKLDLDLNWSAIESKVSQYSFFRFQLNRFNIYYLGLVCVSVAVLIFIGVNKLDYFSPTISEQIKIKTSSNTERSKEYSLENKASNSLSSKFSNRKKPSDKNNNPSSSALIIPIDTNITTTIDGNPEEVLMHQEVVKKVDSLEKPKVKPPVVINRKRDTIIKVDTVYVNKRKKKQ